MNLNPLFTKQKQLDDRINKEKGLQGQDLLDKKILALQVELGELANEWRGFKFWSKNQEPSGVIYQTTNSDTFDYYYCTHCKKDSRKDINLDTPDEHCGYCDMELHRMKYKNPLLEEYADCLSFILSVGNDTGMSSVTWTRTELVNYTTLDSFGSMFYHIAQFERYKNSMFYGNIISIFIHLGKCLGFTWEQIEQAYYKKNEINHARQENGY